MTPQEFALWNKSRKRRVASAQLRPILAAPQVITPGGKFTVPAAGEIYVVMRQANSQNLLDTNVWVPTTSLTIANVGTGVYNLSPTAVASTVSRFFRNKNFYPVPRQEQWSVTLEAKATTLVSGGTALVLEDQVAANNARCNFNLLNGTKAAVSITGGYWTAVNAIAAMSGGWYRCTMDVVVNTLGTGTTGLRASYWLGGFFGTADNAGDIQVRNFDCYPSNPTPTAFAALRSQTLNLAGLVPGSKNKLGWFEKGAVLDFAPSAARLFDLHVKTSSLNTEKIASHN